MSRIHLVGISPEAKFNRRLKDIADEFAYNFVGFGTSDEFCEKCLGEQIVCVMLSVVHIEQAAEIAGHVQIIKQTSPEAFITLVVDKRISPENILFIKKSGANLVLREADFFDASFVEYLLSQTIRGSLIPIKPSELRPNTQLTCNISAMMPLNGKVMPVAFEKSQLTEAKYQKMLALNELYISRDDLAKYQIYTDQHQDRSAKGILARCRLKYLELCKAHANLVYLLYDQSEAASFSQGKVLLEQSAKVASDILENLSSVEDPWTVINNSTLGESGSVERSASIAAMAGLLTLHLKDTNTNDVVLAGLLCDVGVLQMPPSILKKIRSTGVGSLSADELSVYKKHPLSSVNLCLEKKLPLSDLVKSIIMGSHEKQNGTGFPKALLGSDIPKESQLLQYCERVDQALVIKMGQAAPKVREVQNKVIELEIAERVNLSLETSLEIKKSLS